MVETKERQTTMEYKMADIVKMLALFQGFVDTYESDRG